MQDYVESQFRYDASEGPGGPRVALFYVGLGRAKSFRERRAEKKNEKKALGSALKGNRVGGGPEEG